MTDTHTIAHIPDEAVQAALDAVQGNIPPVMLEKALRAALPHLSAPCAVEVKDLAILQRIAKYADEYDEPDENGAWPDMQDAMVTVGDLRALRRILSCVVTKPVDVAAVRRQAFEEAAKLSENDVPVGFKYGSGHGIAAAIRALSAEPAQGDQFGITISSLQAAHIERQKEWCPDQQPDLSFRGNEMAGEVGEACNVIKKLERERQGWRGSRSTKEELASELADVIHTAILCAVTAGIDLEAATVEKFNATSDKNDLLTRLPAALASEAGK